MRDLIGYGNRLPKAVWPQNARLAVSFVLNYEEGSERNVLDGDAQSESYLTDWPGLAPLKDERHLSAESLFEYGSRAGIWRLLSLFERYRLPLTLFTTGLALERNPTLAAKLRESPHEVAGHGYRWINYNEVDEALEREHIKKTLGIIQSLTQKDVAGWYMGRRSKHTRKLIIEAGLRYDSESYADDLPYWESLEGKKHLVIPYALDTNDARYATSPGWNTGEDFFSYLKDAFDYLYQEGLAFPKMMTIGLHARLSGRPGRCAALARFIDYILSFDRIWICRREDIANHWYRHYSI
ncbi:allantoinase PuuE [Candidatus Protochlamydia phocaeensis]|uniref:allantoinase PuuE n=1 Tax=Candidatus Protochlamydia phocaeensis TaxID=1414722 RepID=UPI000837D837|nr:allantoinase PuuE [Candidatus Protochlamydia phocaeensis]